MKKKILKGSLILLLIAISSYLIISTFIIKNIGANDLIQIVAREVGKIRASTTLNLKTIRTENPVTASREMETVESLVGRVQLNYTGNSAVFVEDHSKTNSGVSHISYCKPYEITSSNFEGNSSGGELVKPKIATTIKKAYLCVQTTNNGTLNDEAMNSEVVFLYGGTATGKVTKGVKTKMSNVYYSKWSTYYYQTSGFIDVTDFVKECGYGWYYCCNIPYVKSGPDSYAGWRLIVIEEDETLPLRKLELQLGCLEGGSKKTILTIKGDGLRTISSGNVTGQLLYGFFNEDPLLSTPDVIKMKYKNPNGVETLIETVNGLRNSNRTIGLVMSRNGEYISNYDTRPTQYYYTKDGKFLTSKQTDSWKISGADTELLDVTGKTNVHNVVFQNNATQVDIIAEVGGCSVNLDVMGAVSDVEVPLYRIEELKAIDHDKNYVTMSGTILNYSNVEDIGISEGIVTVHIDKELKILSTSAVFVNSSGSTFNLTEDMYKINHDDNTITYILR